MSTVHVTISGNQTYNGTIAGNSYTVTGQRGEWVYSNGFLYQYNNSAGTLYTLLVFNKDKTISVATSSTEFTSNPTTNPISGATWSGTLPSDAIEYMRKNIDFGQIQIHGDRDVRYNPVYSNYQDTMLAGVLVAMLGASVLIYVFRRS